jgi:hypothetical protein
MPNATKISLSSTAQFPLGSGTDFRKSVIMFQLFVPTAWVGRLSSKKKLKGAPVAAYVPCGYIKNVDDTVASAAIAAAGFFTVDATEADVILDYTHTSGAVDVYYTSANV